MDINGQNTLIIDHLFIVRNIRVNEPMDALYFEGVLYKVLSENLFKDKIIHISNNDNEVTTRLIYEYITHFFGMDIVETSTCQ